MQRSLCSQVYSQNPETAQNPFFADGFGKGQLCALDYNGKNDSCFGDDGGPIQVFEGNSNVATIVGVVSFGYEPCGSVFPSIYTRVATYLDWIERNVWPNSVDTQQPIIGNIPNYGNGVFANENFGK